MFFEILGCDGCKCRSLPPSKKVAQGNNEMNLTNEIYCGLQSGLVLICSCFFACFNP